MRRRHEEEEEEEEERGEREDSGLQEEEEAGAQGGLLAARGGGEIRGLRNYHSALPYSLSFDPRWFILNTDSLIRKPISKPKSII